MVQALLNPFPDRSQTAPTFYTQALFGDELTIWETM
jgi:hypothetical protein